MNLCEKVCLGMVVGLAVGIPAAGFTSALGGEILGLYNPKYRLAITESRFGSDMSLSMASVCATMFAFQILGDRAEPAPTWLIGLVSIGFMVGLSGITGIYAEGGAAIYTPDYLTGLATYALAAGMTYAACRQGQAFYQQWNTPELVVPLLTSSAAVPIEAEVAMPVSDVLNGENAIAMTEPGIELAKV